MNKKLRKEIRELVGIAYKREMSAALAELETKFQAWRAEQIDCFVLDSLIHEYHNGTARYLWKRYQLDAEMLLPYLVADEIIAESELSAELLAEIKVRIQSAKNFREDVENEPEED